MHRQTSNSVFPTSGAGANPAEAEQEVVEATPLLAAPAAALAPAPGPADAEQHVTEAAPHLAARAAGFAPQPGPAKAVASFYAKGCKFQTYDYKSRHPDLRKFWKEAVAKAEFLRELDDLFAAQPTQTKHLTSRPGQGWRSLLRRHLKQPAPEWL